MAKRTPLYDCHIKHGGKIVDFAGYELPVQYEGLGVITEHVAVRTKAGLFDVSHMGELIVSGPDAESALNYLLTNDIRGMYDGQVRYSVLPNPNGGAIDDVLVYRVNGEKFLIVVNASNADKDAAWISSNLKGNVKFENISSKVAQIALQGPISKEIMLKLVTEDELPQKYYSFKWEVNVGGVKCLISRTGYTGEFGYELYCEDVDGIKLYDIVMAAGKDLGLVPAGLGARDTLRLEAGMPLYGHELGEEIMIDEVDLGFAIKMGKEDFVGKAALEAHTPEYQRVGATVVDRGIPREHCDVYCGDEIVGMVTSGTQSPSLKMPIAVLRIKLGYEDKPLEADVRGKRVGLKLIPMPFYKKA